MSNGASSLPTARYLVLLQTSGNQRYIFSTNKRRENVGASELVTRTGTTWVDQAIAAAGNGTPIEVLTRTSGKALLLVKGKRSDAMDLVYQVTERALREAPGLDVAGVVREVSRAETLAAASQAVHREFQSARASRPVPEGRFRFLPFLERCTSSGLPASGWRKVGPSEQLRSVPAMARLDAAKGGYQRMARLLGLEAGELQAVADYLEGGNGTEKEAAAAEWVGVIHADGNGLGRVFASLGENLDDQRFVELTRSFSDAIERCTLWAFREATARTWPAGGSSILPLVLGGDDVTALCDGGKALDFAVHYLESFEVYATTSHADSADTAAAEIIAAQVNGPVTACAGVAIVKPHFPFSEAHQLAVDLASSAKTVKRVVRRDDGSAVPCSAIDFHVLSDSSLADLDRIRRALTVGTDTCLTSKPYVVSGVHALEQAGASSAAMAWAHWRTIDLLRARATLIENRRLPSAPAHDLRAALRISREVAESRFTSMQRRYGGLTPLGNGGTLYWNEGTEETPHWVTGFLDAMEVAKLPARSPRRALSPGHATTGGNS